MKTKLIAVWHVEYAMLGNPQVEVVISYAEAERAVRGMAAPHWKPRVYSDFAITGPHQQRIPA